MATVSGSLACYITFHLQPAAGASRGVDMISDQWFVPFYEMSRAAQARHMADDHGLDPEPVTADELLAEHVVEHQSPRDHVHRRVMIGLARPEDVAGIAA